MSRIPAENDPSKNTVLYHYCSTEVMLSILQNKEIWLSDINTMNDYSESHWAYERFIDAANIVVKDVGVDFVDKVDLILHKSQKKILPFIFCLSSDGDVLSQWRAYADNGAGVSIGFDAESLAMLAVRNVEIIYDPAKQVDHFVSMIRALKDVYDETPNGSKADFLIKFAGQMGVDFSCFKNPAFNEEKEVRLIRAIAVNGDGPSLSFKDLGGDGGEKMSRKGQRICFRNSQGGLIMHIKLPLAGLGNSIIREVVLGPRSPNNGNEVTGFLNQLGFKDFSVRHSHATYR